MEFGVKFYVEASFTNLKLCFVTFFRNIISIIYSNELSIYLYILILFRFNHVQLYIELMQSPVFLYLQSLKSYKVSNFHSTLITIWFFFYVLRKLLLNNLNNYTFCIWNVDVALEVYFAVSPFFPLSLFYKGHHYVQQSLYIMGILLFIT